MIPKNVITLLETATAHHKAGRLQDAGRLYAQVRQLAPSLAEAWQLGGLVSQSQGRQSEAIALLSRAAQLAPRNYNLLGQLASAYAMGGLAKESERTLQAALAIKPDYVEGLNLLGYVYQLLSRIEDSIKTYTRLTEVAPDFIEGWNGLSTALTLRGSFAESIAAADRALKIDPKNPTARYNRGRSLLQSQHVDEALDELRKYLQDNPEHIEARSNRLFGLNYLDTLTPRQLFEEHLEYARRVETPEVLAAQKNQSWPGVRDPERLLRLGVLSPDLRKHSVAYFFYPLYLHLDRSRFEIFVYHDHYTEDPITEQFKTKARVWRNINGRKAEYVEKQIRSDGIDILLDLTGHTGLNRLPLLAKRLAPIQVNYLGYPNTTGLRSIDYRLTDAVVDPEGEADELHTEKLQRFAPTAWCFTPPPETPPLAPPPCLEKGFITFGSFNAFSKLNASTLTLWKRILDAVPGAQLLLKCYRLPGDYWERKLEQHGYELSRVTLLPHTFGVAEHLASYQRVDIALDPHPYNGTTTTCEALVMGLPVVTLRGDRHSARVGASLLTAIGHPEWVAETQADYIAKAKALASNPTALGTLRQHLRADMLRSPLLDPVGQTQRFAEALRTMWRNYCTQARSSSGGR